MAAPVHGSKEYVKYFFTDDATSNRPTSWEIALHTGDPGTGDANESSGDTYQRESVEFEAYAEPNDGKYWEAQSTQDVAFPAGGEYDDYVVTHYTIRNAGNGEALATAKLAVPIPVKQGTVITFPANYIKVRGI